MFTATTPAQAANVREHRKAGYMYRRVKSVITGALVSIGVLSFLLILPAYALAAHQDDKASGQDSKQVTTGQKVETKGMILTRDGENLTVQTRDMGNVVVELH